MSESSPRTSRLPAEPNLRHLKDQAKDLLRSGEAPSLGEALFQIAKLYGFASWPRLKKHIVDQTISGKLKLAIDRDDLDEVRSLLSTYPDLRKAPYRIRRRWTADLGSRMSWDGNAVSGATQACRVAHS